MMPGALRVIAWNNDNEKVAVTVTRQERVLPDLHLRKLHREGRMGKHRHLLSLGKSVSLPVGSAEAPSLEKGDIYETL